MNMIPELIGWRAALAPLTEAHADGLLEAAQEPQIWAFMPRRLDSAGNMAQFVAEAIAARDRGEEVPFAILDRATGQVVGSTRYLDISAGNRSLEIGWTWLCPGVWRTRINTECKYLLLRHAFEAERMIRVQLKTDLRNMRSQAAIERIGGVREGVLRKHRILADGYIRDSVYYSILDDEWPVVKQRLETWLSEDGSQ